MKYATTRLIAALLFTALELWLCFYFGSRPWIEQWASNALLWQALLTSAALIVWVCRGYGEHDRLRELSRGNS
jgi:hypothetical protein